MVKHVTAVIGANYGDEGKGMVTLGACCPDSIIVKHNGGAQAGHTIEWGEKRFVHSQLGAGSVKNAHTYIDETFYPNLALLMDERYRFFNVFNMRAPLTYVNMNCVFTTTFDSLVNQSLEKMRGGARHGSCGHGIFEAFNRKMKHPNTPRIKSILEASRDKIRGELVRLGDWARTRLVDSGAPIHLLENFDKVRDQITEIELDSLESAVNYDHLGFTQDVAFREDRHLVFESGQGLGLDMNNAANHPHLTPSDTGVKNAVDYCKKNGIDLNKIRPIYVTRPYLTRHGAGPLEDEVSREEHMKRFSGFSDETNEPNEWQGELRFGSLSRTARYRIVRDCTSYSNVRPPNVVVTCSDQASRDYHGDMVRNVVDVFSGASVNWSYEHSVYSDYRQWYSL